MYLYQLRVKYEKIADPDPEFDYRKLRKWLAIGFWIFFILYSCYWATFWNFSMDKRNLSWIDFATSAWFGVLIIVYIYLGTRLIKAINKMTQHEEDDPKNAPGVTQVVTITSLMSAAMFLRMIFVPLQDIMKLSKIDSIENNTSYWPYVLTIQCCTELFAVAVVFSSIYLIKKAEQAIAEEPESRRMIKDEYIRAPNKLQ